MWQDGANVADAEVLQSIIDQAGLNGLALLLACDDPEVKAELAANTERAAARGAFGVPTFFVGDEIFWGKERLGQVEAALAQ
jgi:2-hydroxychromene-2-carboxylate isomerase